MVSVMPDVELGGDGDVLVVGEFCQWETFNASCRPDQVVVVTSAMYGRMQAGRCASRSYGSVGCSVDVLLYLSAICSGRQACHLVVPDRHLREMRPCPIDFAAYLEAGYKCVQGCSLVLSDSLFESSRYHVCRIYSNLSNCEQINLNNNDQVSYKRVNTHSLIFTSDIRHLEVSNTVMNTFIRQEENAKEVMRLVLDEDFILI